HGPRRALSLDNRIGNSLLDHPTMPSLSPPPDRRHDHQQGQAYRDRKARHHQGAHRGTCPNAQRAKLRRGTTVSTSATCITALISWGLRWWGAGRITRSAAILPA